MAERLSPEREQEIREQVDYPARARCQFGQWSSDPIAQRPEWSEESAQELANRIEEFEAVRRRGAVEARAAYLHG